MQEKIVEYGTKHKAKVLTASKNVIAVHATVINEGFFLIGHGLEVLPAIGDEGEIIFERDKNRGHWQWHPGNK